MIQHLKFYKSITTDLTIRRACCIKERLRVIRLKRHFVCTLLSGALLLFPLRMAYAETRQNNSDIIQLSPREKETFWSSPWVPTGLSVITPGTGQLYQSNLWGSEKDWFALVRGIIYLCAIGVSYWQMFDNMNRKNPTATIIWSSTLVGLNILAPIDSFFSSNWKHREEEKSYQEQLTRIYNNGLDLAEAKKYEKAILQLKVLPEEAPQFSSSQERIKEWNESIQVEGKEIQTKFDKAIEKARKGDFHQAIKLMETINFESKVYRQSQEKIKQWKQIILEQEAKVVYDQGMSFLKAKKWGLALEQLKKIPKNSAYYTAKVQSLLSELEKKK